MKFCGKVGYILEEPIETAPGIWEHPVVEKTHCGDVLRDTRRWNKTSEINEEVTITNSISIVQNSYIKNNFFNIRYVIFGGVKWKVVNVDVAPPRIVLTLGGKWDG